MPISPKPIPYDEGSLDFDTDYDRENPVTKSRAIKEFNKVTIYFAYF